MREEIIKINLQTDKAQDNAKKLNKEVKQTKKSADKTNESFSGMSSTLDNLTGGAITKFKGLKGSIGGVTSGFKSMRAAIISTGIGALVIAVTSLIAAFKSSEEGQNKFSKLMGVIGTVVGNVVDIVANLGEKLISAFENPKQALADFWNALKQNVVNRINGLLELIPALGRSISLVFKGEFAEAGKVATNAMGKVVLGVEDVVGKTKEAIQATKDFIAEQQREIQITQKIADMRAKADKQERALLIERAEANRRVAELREQAADKENVSTEERIKALTEAGQIEEAITNKEIENARLRFEAKKAENALSKSTKEDLDEEARLLATLTDLETNRLRKQKALTAELTTTRREAASELKAEETALNELIKNIDEAVAIEKEEKRALELEKTREHYNNLIEQAQKNGLDTFELEFKQGLALQQMREGFDAADIEAKKKKAKEEDDIRMAAFEAEKSIEMAKFDLLSKFGGLLGQLAGKNKALQKVAVIAQQAAAVGQIISSTGIANAKAVAASPLTFGQPFVGINNISAGLSIASSIASASKAISQINSAGSGSAVSGGGTNLRRATGAGVASPSFNIVGGSSANQIADVVAAQTSKPVKAYVLTKDVSTGQEMDRNIVEGASI